MESKTIRYRYSSRSGGYEPIRTKVETKTKTKTSSSHRHRKAGETWAQRVLAEAKAVLAAAPVPNIVRKGFKYLGDAKAAAVRKIRGQEYYQSDLSRCITYDGAYTAIQVLQQVVLNARQFYSEFGSPAWVQVCDNQWKDLDTLKNRLQSDEQLWTGDEDPTVATCADRRLIRRLSELQKEVGMLDTQFRRDKAAAEKPSALLTKINRRRTPSLATAPPGAPRAVPTPVPLTPGVGIRVDASDAAISQQLSMVAPPVMTPAPNLNFQGVAVASTAPSDPLQLYQRLLDSFPKPIPQFLAQQFFSADQQRALLPILQNPARVTARENEELNCLLATWKSVKPNEVANFETSLPLSNYLRLKLEILRKLVRVSHCSVPAQQQQTLAIPQFVGIPSVTPVVGPARMPMPEPSAPPADDSAAFASIRQMLQRAAK